MPYIMRNGVKYITSTTPISQEKVDEITNKNE